MMDDATMQAHLNGLISHSELIFELLLEEPLSDASKEALEFIQSMIDDVYHANQKRLQDDVS